MLRISQHTLILRYWAIFSVGLAFPLAMSWCNVDVQIFRLGELLAEQPAPMAMNTSEPKVQHILDKYYTNSLGGEENWGKLQSLIVRGELKFPQGDTFEFTSYRKKPDLSKIVLKLPRNNSITTSFDGKEAWQHFTAETDEPVAMPLERALDFVRDSVFGSHLLYPELTGKKITYLDEKRIGHNFCYQLGISLPNNQYVVVSVDVETGLQVHQEQISSVSGKVESLIQSDFREVAGVNIPFHIKVYSDGELLNETTITSVEANKGIMPWAFQRD